jgi:hypothetical protein
MSGRRQARYGSRVAAGFDGGAGHVPGGVDVRVGIETGHVPIVVGRRSAR